MALEDIGVRAVIENLGPYLSGMTAINKSVADVSAGMTKMSDQSKKSWETMQKIGLAVGGAIVGSLGLMVKAAEAERLSQVKLSVALGNVGVSYADVRKELEATMAATARKTGISDEAQREALSKLVFITGSYERSLSALPVVLDLAAFASMDATSAAMILGRAMSGSTAMLSRYGIYVREGASATEILAAVQSKVAGSAKAMASPFAILKDQMGEMGESIGRLLIPVLKLFVSIVVPILTLVRTLIERSGVFGKAIVYLTGIVGVLALAMGTYATIMLNTTIQTTIATAKTIAHGIAQTYLVAAFAAGIAPATAFGVAVELGIWPLTLIVAAIVAVIAGIVLLIKYWDKVAGVFRATSKASNTAAADTKNLKGEISKLAEQLATQTSDMEKLQEKLTTLQAEYSHVQENAGDYREEIKRLNTAIESNKKEIDRLTDSISKANAELDDLSSPRLAGMQEYEDQIFNVEQQIKKLQLQELQQGESPGLTAQIEALQKQKETLELTRDIKFDPLTRNAREAVETLQGMNKEMAPTAVMARIQALGQQIFTDTGRLGVLTTTTDALTTSLDGIMTIVNGQLETMADNILAVKNQYYDLSVLSRQTKLDMDAANESLQNIADTLKDTKIAPTVPNAQTKPYGGTSLSDIWHKLFGAAYGGFFPQTQPVMVGERGPEVVMMPAGSTVQPNTYNTNYNVNANYSDPQQPASIALDLEYIRMRSRV